MGRGFFHVLRCDAAVGGGYAQQHGVSDSVCLAWVRLWGLGVTSLTEGCRLECKKCGA